MKRVMLSFVSMMIDQLDKRGDDQIKIRSRSDVEKFCVEVKMKI